MSATLDRGAPASAARRLRESGPRATPAEGRRRRLARALGLPLLSVLVFLVVWQAAAASGWWSEVFVPYPSTVWQAAVDASTTHDGVRTGLPDVLAR